MRAARKKQQNSRKRKIDKYEREEHNSASKHNCTLFSLRKFDDQNRAGITLSAYMRTEWCLLRFFHANTVLKGERI